MTDEQNSGNCADLDEYETNLIRVKAAVLVQRGLVPRSEVEDVRQELTLAVLVTHGKVRLNPKTRHGLSARVVDNAASNLLRDRRCTKRNPGRVESLDSLLDRDGEPNELHEASIASQESDVQLQLDVADTLATLPEELRVVAELLKTKSITQAAEELGVARTTLYGSIPALRRRFIRAGLEKYLPTFFVSSDANGVINS